METDSIQMRIKVFQGTTSPKFTWTLRNDFKIYKNIDVSFFMLYSLWGIKVHMM